jgi:hypothetical protein
MKNIAGNSIVTHNLLWGNATLPVNCALERTAIFEVDPELDAHFRPRLDSVCLDVGTSQIELSGERTSVWPAEHSGPAPDLGAYELR